VVLGHLLDLTDVALAVHLTDAGHSSTVSNVDHIHIFIYYQKHQSAAASFVGDLPTLVKCDLLQEIVLSLFRSFSDRSFDIFRKLWLYYDVIVKVIFEELSAFVTSVTIKNTKNL
jgi:hypothetical protein